jgi:hypothetical protein
LILGGDIFEERNANSFVDNTSNACNDAHLDMAMPFKEFSGTNSVQFWRHIGVEEVFLVFGVLAMGEWMSSDDSNSFLPWHYCTHLWKHPHQDSRCGRHDVLLEYAQLQMVTTKRRVSFFLTRPTNM